MSDTWSKEWCPKCKSGNWICYGDPVDCTARDRDAIACYNCHHVFWISVEDAEEIYFGEYNKYDPDDDEPEYKSLDEVLEHVANIDVGRKNPDDPYVSYQEIKEAKQ